MNKKNIQYLNEELGKIKTISTKDLTYSGVELREFKTHYKDGEPFKHADGEEYGIAVFNVVSVKSERRILDFMKEESFYLKGFIRLVDELLLTKYIHGDNKIFNKLKSGDICNLTIEAEGSEKKLKIARFTVPRIIKEEVSDIIDGFKEITKKKKL